MKKILSLTFLLFLLSSVTFAEAIDIINFNSVLPKSKKNTKSTNQRYFNNSAARQNNSNEYSFAEKKKTKNIPDIEVSENDGMYIIKLNTKKIGNRFKPYYVTNLKTSREVFDETNARLVINAGFFDPKNHQTVSYLTLDGKGILNPNSNKSLVENEYLKPYLNKILNRSELRVLQSESDGSFLYDIVPHNEPIPDGYKILHSIQGGPALAPILRLEEEFFVLTDNEGKIISQSASSLSKYARTLVGIKNNDVYFVIATKSKPITLIEASNIMKAAGFSKAMAYDGGGSVSVDYRDKNLHIISDKNETARKLKSFWVVMPADKE